MTTLPPASRALALLAVIVLTPACATKGDLRDVQTEIEALRQDQAQLLQELQRQREVTVDTLRQQTSAIGEFRGSVAQQLRQVVAEIERLGELTGQNQRTLSQIRDQLATMRRTSMTGSAGAAVGGEETGGDTGGGDTAGPDAAYDAAMEQFNRGSFSTARFAFERFLSAYPNDELAPRAQYNIGDILVIQEAFDEALEAFQEVPRRWPDDPTGTVPDALYRIGLLHLELGDPAEARRYLERVVNTYPDDAMADLARERLDEIGG
jgi:tol-pal system protein YbgF